MRNEKELLGLEIEKYLDKSGYVFFTDFRGITVSNVSALRHSLRSECGEFHVIKKSLLKKIAPKRGLPLPEVGFEGQVALVVGGKNPAGIAKLLKEFRKSTKDEKLAVHGGVLDGKWLSLQDVDMLSELPGMDVLRAQFLSLLNTPASKFVTLANAVPQGMLNVLQAKTKI